MLSPYALPPTFTSTQLGRKGQVGVLAGPTKLSESVSEKIPELSPVTLTSPLHTIVFLTFG